MPRAAGLAATIKTAFGVEVELVEGHDGIYQVTAGDQVVYSNSRTCSTGFPDDREIIESLGGATGLTPRADYKAPADFPVQDAACPLPGPGEGAGLKTDDPSSDISGPDTNCGCGPGVSFPLVTESDGGDSDSSCC